MTDKIFPAKTLPPPHWLPIVELLQPPMREMTSNYLAPGGVRCIVISMSVCLFVSLSALITRKPHGRSSPIFSARWLCPWLDSPLASLRYVITYFRFCGWRLVYTQLALRCVICIAKRPVLNSRNRIDSNQRLLIDRGGTSYGV